MIVSKISPSTWVSKQCHSAYFETFAPEVIYRVRAFLKHLPKNNSAILTFCDDVSILRFRYMLRSNPGGSGGRDPSN